MRTNSLPHPVPPDERGVTLQTVILVAALALAAVGLSAVLWNIFVDQEATTPGERSFSEEVRTSYL